MPYGLGTGYGATPYGGISSGTSSIVAKKVGKTFDIALGGVGLLLAPGQKAYSKKAAQTFSFNVRSLFSSSTRLTARDLFFWNRLEHNAWDKGETFSPWAPDSTTPTGLPSNYFQSLGFDTSQPHKLVHLREVKHVQLYTEKVVADAAVHFWPLNDRPGNTLLANLVAASATLALGSTAVLGGGPALYMDTNTSHTSDGTTNGTSQSVAQGALPGTFSMEIWVRPRVLNIATSHFMGFATGSTGISVGIGDGAGGTGSKLQIQLMGVGFLDSGYTFATENIWYHVVVTRDGTTLKYYVNGAQTANTSVTAPAAGAANLFDVGGRFSGKSMRGDEAMFAYYTTTLSLATIQSHYNLGTNGSSVAAQITAGQTYAQFVELYDGSLWINKKNTNILYSQDGGITWTSVVVPGADVTDITTMFTDGNLLYFATANNLFKGNVGTAFAALGTTTGITAGWYDGAQIYVGKATSLYYIDPATGTSTQLYDTKTFTIKWIRGFNGKIWFGGLGNIASVGNRFTRLFTWVNNTLPPSPSNGAGAIITDGSLPTGFITTSAHVYQSLLLVGGYFPYTPGSTTDGYGAVYYINTSNAFGQLFVVGANVSGRSYQVNSIAGAGQFVICGYNHRTGLGRYDLSKGAFATGHSTQLYSDDPQNQVLAVIYHKGRHLFAIQKDGTVWREQSNPVAQAILEESEFEELPFYPKIIDGFEGSHKTLLAGQTLEVQLSSDSGTTWSSKGVLSTTGVDHFDFRQINTQLNHWRTRLISTMGQDATQAPETYNWSTRFSPVVSAKHEWVLEVLIPERARYRDNSILYDVDQHTTKALWSARENGTIVDYIDRDLTAYKVLVMELEEIKATDKMAKARPQQTKDNIMRIEILEVAQA